MTTHPTSNQQTPERRDVRRALVVVPTYDERENVARLLPLVLGADPRVDVLVVDDGSPDGTADVVEQLSHCEPRLHLLRRAGKGGLGSAYRAGFAWALDRDYDAVVEMDADLSHPADRLPALLDALGEADLAIGSRWVPGGATVGWPLRRRLLSRGGNVYVTLALRLGVRDATAGFRAFRREALQAIRALDLTSDGYCFQVESTYVAARRGLRVVEVPITFTERVDGVSKMSGAIVLEALTRVTGWAVGIDRPGASRAAQATTGRRMRGWSVGAKVVAVVAALAVVGGVAAAANAATHRDGPGRSTSGAMTEPSGTRSAPTSPSGPASATGGSTSSHGATGSSGATSSPGATSSAGGTGSGGARTASGSGDARLPVPSSSGSRAQPGDVPVSVTIPAIDVRSSLIGLGIADDGTMQVPEDFDQAGWLETGPAPGDRGPSVIAGHVDSKSGPAVFFRLRELAAGDRVQVRQRDGDVVAFTVRRIERYPKDDFPSAQVYGPVPGPVLRLITCGGTFDHSSGHYRDNVVVYAS